ncbi:MAG: membrane protein [Gammaproteobacteria bacterium]|nr:MAG: membrane protein [Gammaproteobacteria bacterium]
MRVWLILFSLLFATDAAAHRFAPSLLEVTQLSATTFNATWKTPLQKVSATPIEPRFPAACEITSASPWIQEGTGELKQIQLACPTGLVGETLSVSGLGQNQSSALLRITLADDIFHQAVFTATEPDFVVPKEGSAGTVALDYTWLGAEHIWAGPDHLLFVMGLLLLVGWNRRLIYTVTAFTFGHSVTLAMVTLGLFDYPVSLVEFMIALSIYVLAVELARGSAGALWRQPWWLAGGFGLLHGMGFAGALADTGLPQSNVPLALLFFNVGIELGQLAFIALLVLLAAIGGRLMGERVGVLRPLPVYVLGGLSAMWCIERGLEVLA